MTDGDQHVPDSLKDAIAHARALPEYTFGTWPFPYRTLGELLVARAAEDPGKAWLGFCPDDGPWQELSREEFLRRVRSVAGLLWREGIRAGDTVSTLMTNDPAMVVVYFAAWYLGATVAPLNCGEDDDRVEFILRNAEARALFALPAQAARVDRMLPGLPLLTLRVEICAAPRTGWQSYSDTGEIPADLPSPAGDASASALIVYTSGTTGAPKGVVLEHRNLLADAQAIAEWHSFGPSDRAMCVLPLHHVNGTVVTLVTPLFSGGSVLLNSRFSAHAFWERLATGQCTWVSVVPTVLAFLCERPDNLAHYNLSRLRHIICGAGPLTVDLARKFNEAFSIRVVHGYGLSETTCYSSFLPIDLDNAAQRYWLTECGFPSIGCEISVNRMEIQDAAGKALGEHERGEIVIRGLNVMRHYFKRPDANASAFEHGWFRSGDEGFFQRDADGRAYFFITGRLKELIIRGGVNYSPFDIDEVLCAAPGVKAAMAVGFENDIYGEEVGAYVQREEGSDVTEAEIIAHCREHMPYAKCPKVVLFGETFPVTSTGKYQRGKLKELFSPWKSVQFRDRK